MTEEWVRAIEIFCVTTAIGGSLAFLISQNDRLFAIALLFLAIAVALAWWSQKKLSTAHLRMQADITRIERSCLEIEQRLSRMMASLPSSNGQDALFNRIRQALAASYARTQNRLASLEAIDLDAMRIDISQLQADYAAIQESLQAIFQELNQVQLLEQYVMQLKTEEVPQIAPSVMEMNLELSQAVQTNLEQQINELRHQITDLPTHRVNDLQVRLDAIERTLLSFDNRFAEMDQRLAVPSPALSTRSDEIRVLQVLKQKIQEPEAILHPDQSVELPTGMGVEMRFIKLIKRSDAIAICDKLSRMPDLQVPSATISWVRSRFLVGVRSLETVVYRNRYGGTDRYILLHEAIHLIDTLMREFETNQWRSMDSW